MNIETLTVVGSNVAMLIGCFTITITLFLWARGEGNTERRIDRQETLAMIESIHSEMKDFHTALINIERRR